MNNVDTQLHVRRDSRNSTRQPVLIISKTTDTPVARLPPNQEQEAIDFTQQDLNHLLSRIKTPLDQSGGSHKTEKSRVDFYLRIQDDSTNVAEFVGELGTKTFK